MNVTQRKTWFERAVAMARKKGTGEIATVDCRNGSPHVSMMFMGFDDKLNVYIMTKTNTNKAKNLEADPRAAITVCDVKTLSIQLRGKAVQLSGKAAAEAKALITASASLYPDIWPPVSRLPGGSYVAYRIKPESIRLLDLDPKSIDIHASALIDLL